MSQTCTTVVISLICAEYAASATFVGRQPIADCSLMQPSKKGSSYNFYFMSRILYCCTAALFSIVAALSSPPTASRFRDVIFRRRNPFVDSDCESLPQLYFPSSQPFTTSFVVAAFLGLRSQVASATLSFVVTAFRRLLPSTHSLVDSALPRLHLPSSQSFVDSFRRRSPSSTPTSSRFRDLSFRRRSQSQPFVLRVSRSDGRTYGRTVGRSE